MIFKWVSVRSLSAMPFAPCSNTPYHQTIRGNWSNLTHRIPYHSANFVSPIIRVFGRNVIWKVFFFTGLFRCSPVVCSLPSVFVFVFVFVGSAHNSTGAHDIIFRNNISLLARAFGQFSFILHEIYGWNWFQYVCCCCFYFASFVVPTMSSDCLFRWTCWEKKRLNI